MNKHFNMTFTARQLLLATTMALGTASVWSYSAAHADEKAVDNKIEFDIPTQPLSQALFKFSEQSKIAVLSVEGDLKNKQSPSIKGRYAAAEALKLLLANSGVTYEFKNPSTLLIRRIDRKMLVSLATWDSASEESAAQQNESASEQVLSKKTNKSSIEEMIVEDTKIKPFSDLNVDLPRTINDPQPYYIFDAETIQRSAATSVEDFLKQRLTMNTTFQTSGQMYGLNGAADGSTIPGSNNSAINLRGLGIDKTLILVNGRRMAGVNYSDGNEIRSYQPDLNGIPLASIERIEVLPSSASAIYGGSAMGGVINVILKNNYQGGEMRYNYSAPSSSDASASTADANYGFSLEGGKTHITAAVHYSTSDPMLFGERVEFMQRGIARTVAQGGTTALYGIGQRMGPTVNLVGKNANRQLTNIILDDGTNLGTPYAHIAPGSTSSTPASQRFIPGWIFTPTPGYGSFGLKQPLGVGTEVKSFNISSNRQMNSWLNIFADYRWSENTAETFYHPLESSNFAFIATANPGNPFQNSNVDVYIPPGTQWPVESVSLTQNITVGFKGSFANGWIGEVDYTLSKNEYDHDFIDTDGQWMGRDHRNGLIDFLVDPYSAQPDLSKYYKPHPYEGFSTVDDFAVRLTGPALRMPWGDLGLAIGLQRTKSSVPESSLDVFYNAPGFDVTYVTGNSPNTRTTYFAQSQISDALYVEGIVPLVTAKNAIPLVSSLDLQIAHRTSRYIAQTGTSSMSVTEARNGGQGYVSYSPTPADSPDGYTGGTPMRSSASYSNRNETFGLKYKPVEAITLRTSLGTAFLPPTYAQLIPDQNIDVLGATISTPTGTYDADAIRGGNPNLKPQRSKNFDVGLIFEPQDAALKGLRANVEYYKITQRDFIQYLSPEQILADATLSATRVTRDPVSGLVTLIDLSLTNVAEYTTSGIDLSLNYAQPTAFGLFNFYLLGTRINDDRRQIAVNSPAKDYVNYPSAGGPVRYKANAIVNWSLREWSLGWATNWFGSYNVQGTAGDPTFTSAYYAQLQGGTSIPSQLYHHLFASYTFDKGSNSKLLSDLTVQLNVNNVLNTIPPVDMNFRPFYVSPLGDYRMRAYSLSIKKAF